MSFRDQGRIRDHNRTIIALGADEDKAEIKRTPLAHWPYRYIGNGSEPTSCAVLIKIVGVPEMKDHESPNTSFDSQCKHIL